jgi:2-dehydro-3-deoxygluconokinase
MDCLVIGEPLIELYSDESLSEATSLSRSFGGDVLNTAVTLTRMGSSAGLVTRWGADPFSAALQKAIKKEGIGLVALKEGGKETLKDNGGKTGIYVVQQNGVNQEPTFWYHRNNTAAALLKASDITPAMIQGLKMVYATGVTLALSESARKAVIKAFTLAREYGVMTAFDPNFRATLWPSKDAAFDAFTQILPYVDIVFPTFPNDVTPFFDLLQRPHQVIEYFWVKGIRLVVVKAGANGCYIGYHKQIEHVPATEVRAADTTGAGDVFNGAFLHGMMHQIPLVDCARLANTAAGLSVQRRGTFESIPQRDAVLNGVNIHYHRSVAV